MLQKHSHRSACPRRHAPRARRGSDRNSDGGLVSNTPTGGDINQKWLFFCFKDADFTRTRKLEGDMLFESHAVIVRCCFAYKLLNNQTCEVSSRKGYGPEPRQWCGGETGQFQRSERPVAAAASFGRRKWNQSQHRTSFTKDRSVGNRQSWHNILLVAVLGKATVLSLMFKSCTKMHLNNSKRPRCLGGSVRCKEDEYPRSHFTERLRQCLASIHQPELMT